MTLGLVLFLCLFLGKDRRRKIEHLYCAVYRTFRRVGWSHQGIYTGPERTGKGPKIKAVRVNVTTNESERSDEYERLEQKRKI